MADDPYRCPPSSVQVHFRQDGWTGQIVMHYARRSAGEGVIAETR